MSSTMFPCGCKVRYQEEKAQKIEYCGKHQKLYNKNLSLDQNAGNLEDQIYDDLIASENNIDL